MAGRSETRAILPSFIRASPPLVPIHTCPVLSSRMESTASPGQAFLRSEGAKPSLLEEAEARRRPDPEASRGSLVEGAHPVGGKTVFRRKTDGERPRGGPDPRWCPPRCSRPRRSAKRARRDSGATSSDGRTLPDGSMTSMPQPLVPTQIPPGNPRTATRSRCSRAPGRWSTPGTCPPSGGSPRRCSSRSRCSRRGLE